VTASSAATAGRSRWTDIDGPVHYLDFGGPAGGPLIVCVHGLGGSAVNWSAIAPLLTDRYRILAPDLAGHGLTRSAGRGADVPANRALLHRFIKSVAAGPVLLMGNSMGGMISLLEATAAPEDVAGLMLLDPVVPFVAARPDPLVIALFAVYATPGLGRVLLGRRRHLSSEALVARTLSLCCVDGARVPADVIAQHIRVARQRAAFTAAGRDFAAASRSVLATAGYVSGRAYRRGIRSITCPVLLVHGERQSVLVTGPAAGRGPRASPGSSTGDRRGDQRMARLSGPASGHGAAGG
jgi:pimeloyl-ACP methyl ester carboxylesterase